jgi:hypothetical protein
MLPLRPRSAPYHIVDAGAVVHHSKIARAMTGSGHFSPLPYRNSAGRFTSGSSRNSDKAALTLRATTGLMRCSKKHFYSITSSARASNAAGTSTPIVFAVCRLMTNSNFVARRIGRSAGFAPLRMRPVKMPSWRSRSLTFDP